MRFEFATATRIIFGPGTIEEVPPIASEMGRRAFVVIGRTSERAGPLLDQLKQQGIEFESFNLEDVERKIVEKVLTQHAGNISRHGRPLP